jgi:TRAP-type C4-dicarboxylate transport system substrate-binding protein
VDRRDGKPKKEVTRVTVGGSRGWSATVFIGTIALMAAACGPGAAPSATGATQGSAAGKPGELGPGPSLTIEMIGQPGPNLLQYTKVEKPYIENTLIPASKGRIKINLTTRDERNLQGQDLARLVSNGQEDIVWLSYTFIAGDFPIVDGLDLAGLNPTVEKAKQAADAFVPAMNKAVESRAFAFLYSAPFAPQVVYCREPFDGLNGLKGKKIRTFGVTLNDFVKGVGAQAVSLAFPETYSALERGVVDCGITGTATGNSSKWFEVTKAYMNLYLTWGTSAYAVNTKWWNGLPADVRAFLDFHLKELSKQLTDLANDIASDGSYCNQGLADKCKLGVVAPSRQAMKEVPASDADKAALAKLLTSEVIPSWVKRCGSGCGDAFNQYIAPIAGVKYTP